MKDLIPEMNEQYNIYPTIIFDVERSGQESQDVVLNVVRSFSKSLAHTCRCIIILSEANNAVLQFGNDVSREKFIFVDEFCLLEAKRYLQKQNYPMTDDELDYFFHTSRREPCEACIPHRVCPCTDDFDRLCRILLGQRS
jgi:hypothetical protein